MLQTQASLTFLVDLELNKFNVYETKIIIKNDLITNVSA